MRKIKKGVNCGNSELFIYMGNRAGGLAEADRIYSHETNVEKCAGG